MQKAVRIHESQLLYLSSKCRQENTISGFLYKKSSDTGKWQLRWFALYQNLLFYFENDSASRPSGVALLEGCYCDRNFNPGSHAKGKDDKLVTNKKHPLRIRHVQPRHLPWILRGSCRSNPPQRIHDRSSKHVHLYCFTITYKSENQRQYDLKADTESECAAWIDAVKRASYNKLVEQKEELEQKHLHLLQILDSERQAKWHYVQQTEEMTFEVKRLKAELQRFTKDRRLSNHRMDDESDELRKIKKVQSFFRGWLCRRRWKQIVELYIRSPHAESMRKRNSIVFSMVECEEEYNRQLSALVTCFLRPLRMAASSKKPPITHEDVNSIFLNSETLLFLHQIFLKGLTARLENWPTLVLGDLFDMLLPMLCIYQEYVRNHHYSLQVLAEYKQKPEFNTLLKRYEEKPVCEGRTLDTFLTYPMHQVPRYIITLHELLAHTPHDHVERESLEYAQSKLEELSRIMHDEVSETENIRKNLSIERMIVEGCDILLDVTQTFVRQGPLIQPKVSRGRLGSISSSFKDQKKESVRQVFLFTNHMLLTTRTSNGKLHLAKHLGKIPLIDCTLVEDPSSDPFNFDDDNVSVDSTLSIQSCERERTDYNGLDFRLIVDAKSGPPVIIILVASTQQEKAAWCSDISQCIENLHYSDLLNSSMSESSSVTMPQSVRSDPKLFRDDVDIKFSRTLNSCKVPQIRHASVDRLLDRLTDLRFLSIDFLNTFLLTYRVFTTGRTVLEALKRVYRNPEYGNLEGSSNSVLVMSMAADERVMFEGIASPPPSRLDFPAASSHLTKPQAEKSRRISTGSMKIDVTPEETRTVTFDTTNLRKKIERAESTDSEESQTELTSFLVPPRAKVAPIARCETLNDTEVPLITTDDSSSSGVVISDHDPGESSTDTCDSSDFENRLLPPPCTSMLASSSETLTGALSSAISSDTLTPGTPARSPIVSPLGSPKKTCGSWGVPVPSSPLKSYTGILKSGSTSLEALTGLSPSSSPKKSSRGHISPIRITSANRTSSPGRTPSPGRVSPGRRSSPSRSPVKSPTASPKLKRASSPIIKYSLSSPNMVGPQLNMRLASSKRGSAEAESISTTTRSSFAQVEGSPPRAKAGTVVTSSRASTRRSSSSAATVAFAAATAGSGIPTVHPKGVNRFLSAGSAETRPQVKKRESVISTAATMRVLNVLKHWVSKHSQDFECDPELKAAVTDLLEEMVCNSCLLPAEHKASVAILRQVNKVDPDAKRVDLEKLLLPPATSSKDTFDTLSALDIAEQLTYLDHQIFVAIRSEELLCQAWMKPNKSSKAVHVLLVSKRFNEVSRLVVSEIVGRGNQQDRVSCIEKWAAIADICRCMHNYNGVLQICAAFVNSSVYRLKKTWEKLSKQTKQMIERLQTLVSSDGRFKNMREALHRCDPPCIPYLGMYLTDLSFIEEGTPNFTEDGLVNFSKMRMIAHVIREIRLFQQTPYRIEHHARITNYLLDPRRLLDEEQTYKASLGIEPKQSRLSVVPTP